MRKGKFTDEQMVKMLRESERSSVAEVAKKYGVSEQTLYAWRKRFGAMSVDEAKRLRARAMMLAAYRSGELEVLVTCRALDEGFNVPETEIGIIAASTATRRQRIQRLGRVLRPASGKEGAIIYTLVATAPEIGRLQEEEKELEGVAEVTWSRA